MIAASVGKKQIGKVLLGVVAAVIVVTGGIYFLGKGKASSVSRVDIPGGTAEEREAYLLSIGLQVDTTSSVAEVGVPEEFDERFEKYNEMLKTTGFDLSDLKGETVKKCTYTVTNKPELGPSVSAILLVYEDKIVAGHLVDNTTSALYPLFEVQEEEPAEDTTEEPAEETTEETILPSEDVSEDAGAEQPEESETAGEPEDQETSTVPEDAYPTE